MRILSIETSCDETALSVVDAQKTADGRLSFSILGNVLASQIALHREYGGVFPALAKREHGKAIIPLLLEVLEQADMKKDVNEQQIISEEVLALLAREPEAKEAVQAKLALLAKPDIDLIAVTNGPGLEPALWVGVSVAKALATLWNIPVIGVNHMEGHVLSSLAPVGTQTFETVPITFPALSLLVSGGHTELVIMKAFGIYEKIGQTVDDACGEAFDKVARMLELPYPGGPEISRLAEVFSTNHYPLEAKSLLSFPRPMLHSKNYDFSFSGLKTAVLYYIRDHVAMLNEIDKMAIAHEFQNAVVDVLVAKTIRAAEEYNVRDILVGGGVAQNTYLQKILRDAATDAGFTTHFPRGDIAGDNALMIAFAGFVEWQKKEKSPDVVGTLRANGTLSL